MEKIKMTTPIVELDGDEMTRLLWQWIKEDLILPYVDLKSKYFDLGIKSRDDTDDLVTIEAANAIKTYGVGVKCATITANEARRVEYDLKHVHVSPNGTLRAVLDGTVFRAPIIVEGIEPYIPRWKKPITIARHAYGDIYSASEIRVEGPAKAELVVTYPDGTKEAKEIYTFEEPGIVMGMHNKDSSIENFARTCFEYAIETKQDLYFATKDTISKDYDQHFKFIFQRLFDTVYKEKFEELGLEYFYTLIDDMVARAVRSEGGFIWACKNYDGDVMSDMISTAYGSLAMMSSVLISPEGQYEYEAAHGTVQRHYYKHLKGEETSTNSVATIVAWTGALRKRGELDGNDALVRFANILEQATLQTIADGEMTKDLVSISSLPNKKALTSREFLKAIQKRLEVLL